MSHVAHVILTLPGVSLQPTVEFSKISHNLALLLEIDLLNLVVSLKPTVRMGLNSEKGIQTLSKFSISAISG